MARGYDNLLGDDHRSGQGHGDILVASPETLVAAAQRFAELIDVGDVAVGDDILGERLHSVALEPISALPNLGELDELQRSGAYVDTNQRRSFRLQERKRRIEFFLEHGAFRRYTYKLH